MKNKPATMKRLVTLLIFALGSIAHAQTPGQNSLERKPPTGNGSIKENFTLGNSQILGRTAAGVVSGFTLGSGFTLSGTNLSVTSPAPAWADITGKPTEFTPAAHTQAINTITGLQTELDAKLNSATAASTYQPIDADLTSWAAITRASGFDTFTSAPSSANLRSVVTDETGTGALVFAGSPVFTTQIVTPAIEQPPAASDLEIQSANGASLMFFRNSNIRFASAATNITFDPATASTIAHFDASKNLSSLPIATYPSLTELSYVKGVTSAIQTQLAARATLTGNTFTELQQFSGTTHAGLRLNNLTTVQRDAIASPAAGMAIWNNTANRLQLHNGSGWTAGMVRMDGDVMTGALAITQGTANTAVLTSTGYNVTGSGTGSMINLSGTHTSAGAGASLVKVALTNTSSASGAAITDGSKVLELLGGASGASNILAVAADGKVFFGANATNNAIRALYSWHAFEWCSNNTAVGELASTGLRLNTNAFLNFGGPAVSGIRVSLSGNTQAVLAIGVDTSTASATAEAQTIRGPNATGTTSTGGSLTIQGGTGTLSGGAVIIRTAATTTQTERARFSSAGLTIGASGTAISTVLSAAASLDFPSTSAQSSSDLTITVTGAADGDVVVLGVPNAATNANVNYTARVSAADTVNVRFNNYSSGAIDPASATFRATVIKH
jgi:hypothetical protein